MTNLEHEIQSITEQYQMGNLSQQERDSLLVEIRDVRSAYECAGNEEMFRYIMQACNVAMSLA
jgi:hypothetical protein